MRTDSEKNCLLPCQAGVDPREYGRRYEEKLRAAEMESIQDYLGEAEALAALHAQVLALPPRAAPSCLLRLPPSPLPGLAPTRRPAHPWCRPAGRSPSVTASLRAWRPAWGASRWVPLLSPARGALLARRGRAAMPCC